MISIPTLASGDRLGDLKASKLAELILVLLLPLKSLLSKYKVTCTGTKIGAPIMATFTQPIAAISTISQQKADSHSNNHHIPTTTCVRLGDLGDLKALKLAELILEHSVTPQKVYCRSTRLPTYM